MDPFHNPAWFFSSIDHHKLSLSKFSISVLKDAALCAKIHPISHLKTKSTLIDSLLFAYLNTRNLIMPLSDSEILTTFPKAMVPKSYISRPDLIYKYFSFVFGDVVASAFCVPQDFPEAVITPSAAELLSDLYSLIDEFSTELKSSKLLTKKVLLKILENLHPSRCPAFTSSFASRLSALTQSFRARCLNLMFADRLQIIDCIVCWEPLFPLSCDWTYKNLIMYLLKIEYSSDFIDRFTQGREFRTSLAQRCDRAQQRQLNIESDLNFKKEIYLNWPVIPSEETVYCCLAAYRAGTIWKLPHPCACCVRTQHGAQTEVFSLDDPESLYISGSKLGTFEEINILLPSIYSSSYTTIF